MELAFLTPLLKDGAKSVSGGVTINNKGLIKTGLMKDRGGANGIDKSVEHRFVCVVPVKFASFRAVCNKGIQRGSEHAEITDIHVVEIEKPQERSKFM